MSQGDNPQFLSTFKVRIDGCGDPPGLLLGWFANAIEAGRSAGYAATPLNLPVPMVLTCPGCGERHIDEGEFATKVHHTHACQSCGLVWRPAKVATVGVRFLPGYKNEEA